MLNPEVTDDLDDLGSARDVALRGVVLVLSSVTVLAWPC